MNTVAIDGMDREECALLMALSTIDGLKKKGVIEGGYVQTTASGEEACTTLRTAGFEFNDGELESILMQLFNSGEEQAELENVQ